MIVFRDMNQVLHPYFDKSPPTSAGPPAQGGLASLLSRYLLVDAWREVNPTLHSYTFYSHPQNSFSRTDHVLLHASLPLLLFAHIQPVAWSDHDAVIVTLS